MSTSESAAVTTYPVFASHLPETPLVHGRYTVSFARSPAELQAVQRLRFEVFNREMGEGLAESWATGLDQDRFDAVCHHLIVTDHERDEVIGTYRMQTTEMAERYLGFYSADEFDLRTMPPAVMRDAFEVGRACVAKAHRNRHVLFLLWRGLATYVRRNRKRYLFGCCSLTSQDPIEGKRVMSHLEAHGHVHPTVRVDPQPGWRCYEEPFEVEPPPTPVDVPKLFGIYLRYGAKVCGPPAIDRFFKTIDYLVLLDVEELEPDARALFFG